jgi:sugar/nucleoside kinase (ribokinase family)
MQTFARNCEDAGPGGCDVVALGEPLVVMVPDRPGPLRTVPTFERSLAGAETNVLRGMARLGARCGLVSRVGDDEFGMFTYETLRAAGIDVSRCGLDPTRHTGIYFKELSALGHDTRPVYYRSGSAASAVGRDDVDDGYVRASRIFLTTGITALLSPESHEAVAHALRVARGAGVVTAFDPNLRPGLWGADRLHELILPLLEDVDVYLGGERETEALFGAARDVRELAERVRARGPRDAVIKRGALGAVSLTAEGWCEVPPFRASVEESVGAGDAFNAGYLYFRDHGAGVAHAMQAAAVCGSAVCAGRGDFETFPRWNDLIAALGDSWASGVTTPAL